MIVKNATIFILQDDVGRVLLQHRTSDAPKHPNCWGIFGGFLDDGEKPEVGVRREAQEELGIELNGIRAYKTFTIDQVNNTTEKTFVFLGKLEQSVEQLRSQLTEGQGLGVFSYEEAKKLSLTRTAQIILKEFFSKKE